MCGIAGYIGSEELPTHQIPQCLDKMRHRGPDAASFRHWITATGRHVYLLHTRLKIIDLNDRANQPFHVGSHWMVYNGEIYNHLELREMLVEQGVYFTTTSDTEVLLQMVHTFGFESLDSCEGMWAFALFNEAEESLTLCRDRFGEKPLYLYREASGLYFGSEVKSIVALRGQPLAINFSQLYRYLIHGYKALYKTEETYFENLKELPARTLLHIDRSGQQTQQAYWQPAYAPNESMTRAEAVEGARTRLTRSLELRLRADVPLAFCLSGGIDSNSLISIAKRFFNYDVHGFTIVIADQRYDEEEIVASSVNTLGIRHTVIRLTPGGFLSRLRQLIHHHDGPIATITYFVHGLLMEQMAAHGYRISISGTGADELFSGYYDHHLAYLAEIKNDLPLAASSRKAWLDHIQPLVQNPWLKDPDLFIRNPAFRDHIFLDAKGFAQYLRDGWHEDFTEVTFTGSLLRNRMLNEMFHENVPVILHEDDLNAMSFSIENRSPFLDRALFEFCYRIPTQHLIREGFSKAILREAMENIVPEPILKNHRKIGFNAPIHALLDTHHPDTRQALLTPSPIFEHIRRDKIEQLLDKSFLPNSESKFLFYFLNSKIFLEDFCS